MANEVEVEVKDVSSVEVFGRKAKNFDKLVEEMRELQALRKSAEEGIRNTQKKLEVYFADTETKSILSGTSRATLVMSSNSHIDKLKLIEAGVPAETIVSCTETTKFAFIRVTAR